uniref:Uncharacterized protein n=1 Tax=Podoviridae sp. ctIlO27 TaxID=2825238 RepID=A0A8S5PZR1_9CAUD|nr:MAG TPA: hypothetical protein [Podoviridae sp. ctIlO27]
MMPGVPDMSKASAQRRGAAPIGCFQHPAFSIGENAFVNLEKFQ